MPLYDCMLLVKPRVVKESQLDLIVRIAQHVFRRNGVITDIKSFGNVFLGYGIKKLDGRYYQGKLLQMTMMATPNLNKELHYLNQEDRLLRWLLVKHRGTKYGPDFGPNTENRAGFLDFPKYNFSFEEPDEIDNENDDEDDDEDNDDDEEYENEAK